jgi:hypothetical protein
MNHASAGPFDSIESAHDFVRLFFDSVADAKRDIESDIQREAAASISRRLDALRLAAYNLEKLEQHLRKSRIILNDLRSIRRLLFEERTGGRAQPPSKPVPAAVVASSSAKAVVPNPLPSAPAPSEKALKSGPDGANGHGTGLMAD